MTIINYAAYAAYVEYVNNELIYDTEIHGMWDIDRYVNLLMGEIPRLTDDTNEVKIAFEELKSVYKVRKANPLYASK